VAGNYILVRVARRTLLTLSVCDRSRLDHMDVRDQFHPSICPSVTLVIHVKTVQDVEIGFTPYDTLVYKDSSCEIL